jgi:hypothetical protein
MNVGSMHVHMPFGALGKCCGIHRKITQSRVIRVSCYRPSRGSRQNRDSCLAQ